MRGTKKQNAQSFLLQSPHGFRHAGAEKAASRKSSPRGKDRKHEEDALQIAVCQLLDCYPQILYWATPNARWVGELDRKKLAYLAKQKRMGVKRGVPDLTMLLPLKLNQVGLIFLELKVGDNKATDEQFTFMERAIVRGATCRVVHSVDEVAKILKECGI